MECFVNCNSQMICSNRVIYACFGCWCIIWVSWNANNVFQHRWFFFIVTRKRRIFDVAFLNWIAEIEILVFGCFCYDFFFECTVVFAMIFFPKNLGNWSRDKFFSYECSKHSYLFYHWDVVIMITRLILIIIMWSMEHIGIWHFGR